MSRQQPMQPTTRHTFEIKQGDTAPVLETVLLDGDEEPLDLTSAISVGFTMVLADHPRTRVLDYATADFDADTTGTVRYPWQPGDTDVAGTYNIEWTPIFPVIGAMTVPSRGYDTVQVNKRA